MGPRTDEPDDFPDAGSLPPPGDPALANTPLPLKIRGARYLMAGLLVAVIVTVVGSTYFRIEQQLRATLEGQLEGVLEENVHVVATWLDNHEGLARKTAALPQLEELVTRYADKEISSGEASEILRTDLALLLQTRTIDGAHIYGPGGESWFSAATSNRPEPPLQETWRAPQAQAVAHLSRDGARLRVETIAPLGAPDRPLAYLAIFSEPEENPLFPRVFGGGTTYAFDKAGTLERDVTRSSGLAPGARRAAMGDPSVGENVEDYVSASGEPVIGAWKWIDEHRIGIATEVPADEALSSIARLRRSFLVLVILVGAAVLGFIALGRWTLRVREESLLMTRRLGRLARAIQPLSAALEHDPSAVVLVDGEGQVVYANAASHRVLGVSSPLLGQDVDEVFDNLHAELQAALISGRDSIVAQGTGNEDETLLVSSRNLTIDGNPHFLYMLRPVTQQVRRQEVEHWKKLIRVLSHELNNALAPITSLLSSARKVNQMTHQDARLGEIFESIAERTGHLISFIEGYREVARLPRPDQKETDWEVFLTSLESQKGFRRVGTVPKRAGYFDPVQLERVLVNVLNNSLEAGSKQEDVTVEVLQESAGFRVNVADRGTGMPEPVLKQAMLPFFSTKRTGTGVGLALSREIIEAHGGQLTLANREGGGLVVSCFLPHPLPPPAHPSRSRVPISIMSTHEDSELPEASNEPT